jgi:site-specific recombinase XerD
VQSGSTMSATDGRHLKTATDNLKQYAFCEEQGKPHNTKAVSVALLTACRTAKIENRRFHDLRHDFANVLINNGAVLFQVQGKKSTMTKLGTL